MILVAAALAGVSVGPAAVRDGATATSFAGLDLQLSGPARGVQASGRVSGGLDMLDASPVVMGEAGFLVVVPLESDAIIRVGPMVRTIRVQRTLPGPFDRGRIPDGRVRDVIVPSAYAVAEVIWTPEQPLTVGIQAGVSPTGSVRFECLDLRPDEPVPGRCVIWPPGLSGGFLVRKQFGFGLVVEGMFGPHSRIGISWAPGALRARRARAATAGSPD